ncbi:efflux RND transporter periplasmic adaptor subunit [Methylomarinum sp. Ch1-1]|uniref:Efflux RND transporter periplasmic adaptor subunit n=1 Tax=Methylomarinum roseum TaxID=3067653 RepID=A0AAU7NYL0_9GAMM|nr:efflux RND transporter periplasmic adaptor subunit [Methylomarinum sp. Ch1-1]MDP4521909.1 efflux RND transporter periplasmic adaptor subunit [Methylomarinum sp. Ch1-1]
MNRNSIIAILGIIVGGLLLAVLILASNPAADHDEHQHEESTDHDEDFPRGPHHGRLLSQDDFELEVTIYETGIPPQFRVYAYQDEKPLPPAAVQLEMTLLRLGGRREQIGFKPVDGYLLGDRVVEEPHSFAVKVEATFASKTYSFQYSQEEGRVHLPPAALESAGISVETAGPAEIERVLKLPGTIEFDQNHLAHVVPRVGGIVVEVRKRLGETVTRGEVLAVLESRDLAELKSRLATARKRLQLARSLYRREEQLWRDKISAEQDYLRAKTQLAEAEIAVATAKDQLEALGLDTDQAKHSVNLARYELRSPLNGTVMEKHLVAGEAVKADARVFVIADLSEVWGSFNVPANDLNRVRIGQQVRIQAPELGYETQAVIDYLGALVGEQTRSAPAHVHIENPERRWRPGLFVSVEVIEEKIAAPVTVSLEALQTWRGNEVVFVQSGDEFEVRPLKLGRRDTNKAEVIKGLVAGERYAVTNSFVLKADLGKAGATHQH